MILRDDTSGEERNAWTCMKRWSWSTRPSLVVDSPIQAPVAFGVLGSEIGRSQGVKSDFLVFSIN